MSIISSLQRSILRLLLHLSDPWKIKISGGEPIEVLGRRLDTDLQLVCRLARFNPDISAYPPKKARKKFTNAMSVLAKYPLSLPKVETTVIGKGDSAFKIRIYNPDPTRDNLPILIYYHGGGFVVGSIDSVDEVCRYLAYRTPCLIFSVNYRLAPEYPFPIPLEDSYRAYEWVKYNAYRLGGNPERISLAGDSAGGNLALGVTAKLKEAQENLPNFLGLIYPVIDMSREAPSYETFRSGFLLTRKIMRWFRDHYLPDPSLAKDPLASPIYSDTSSYPPVYLSTAGFDPLSDEGKEFAEKLSQSGVRVTHTDFPGLVHTYFGMGSMIPSCKEAVEDFIKFMKTEWSIHPETDSGY